MTAFLPSLLHGRRADAADESEAGVLIVDDEESVRRFIDRTVRVAGYVPVCAPSGADAIREAAAMPRIDLLITDMMMPDMNGDEVARQLRAIHPGLKVLYLTGYSDRLFERKSTLWDDEAFLDKPCSITALTQAVSLLMSGRIDSKPAAAAAAEEVRS